MTDWSISAALTARRPCASEIRPSHAERVRAKPGEHMADTGWPLRERDALQLAHVTEPELAAAHREHHPVVPVPLLAGFGPVQPSGHAEMHEQRRAVCPGDQPLTVPFRVAEPAAAQRPLKMPGVHITEHSGIGHLDMLHPAAGAMLN